ncbi:uncharacterized protein [Eleutherodactylus coqui]|uniref:uncharacterized protein n=1 Tax=Eleutherodactylus coqui TaxID=57060 RepID=UPI003462E4C2
MSTREDPETLLTDRDTQKPREARRRSKKCPVCLTKLDDSCTKTLCATCSAKIMQEEKTSLMAEIRSVVREEVQSSLSDLQPGPSGVTRRSVPAVSESDSDIAENVDFDGEVTQEDTKYLFSTADMDQLLKAVRRTMQVEEDVQQPRTVQEDMFAGLLPQQKSSFPVNAALKQLILNEWESVDQAPLIPREFKERLLFPGDEVSFLDEIPKIDTAIAMVSRKSGLPFEDTSHLKDPPYFRAR